MLQTRNGKRSAQAMARVAVDMVDEGLVTSDEALRELVDPGQIRQLLLPQLDVATAGTPIATGVNASPGAAVGAIVFQADEAEERGKTGERVVLVRDETTPDDLHGMIEAQGILTARGGKTSHAAIVAVGMGKPAVCGVSDIEIDEMAGTMTVGGHTFNEGDMITIDGTGGGVFVGEAPLIPPQADNPYLMTILTWADAKRTLKVRTNADTPEDAEKAREFGAEGIGLCRTEHMFFEEERLPVVQEMILASNRAHRIGALERLLPVQREDFAGLFRAMDGLPVIIRLLDPPLHEFLPGYNELVQDLADLKVQLQHCKTLSEIDNLLSQVRAKEDVLARVKALSESNPMLGLRGDRLSVVMPEITEMQVRAIFEAAIRVTREGIDVHPEIMVPLAGHVNELKWVKEIVDKVAKEVFAEHGTSVDFKFGSMIEVPRAALTADEFASVSEFYSFGTNDLTQTTFGMSRDDAEA
jgi:pyruvate,orthophosphate dikinase